MFDYLEKYKNLPKEVRDKISTPEILVAIENLEKKYGVNLAVVVMKIMTKDLSLDGLDKYLGDNFKLDKKNAELLLRDLETSVFINVYDYLGVGEEKKVYSSEINSDVKDEYVVDEGEDEEDLVVKGNNFLFSQEDEKEIKELAKKIKIHEQQTSSEDLDEKLNEIVKKAQINFGSELLAGRFFNILKTYLKGIRGRIEAKQALMKPVKSGGLDFDLESAEQVLKIADGDSNKTVDIKIEPPKRIKVPEDMESFKKVKDIGARDVAYDFSSLKKKAPLKLDTTHELAPPHPALRNDVKASTEIKKEIKKEELEVVEKVKKEVRYIEKKPEKPIIKKPESFKSEGKIKIEDVKFRPKVMSPVDELRYMNLINFRRLGEDPIQATEKIKEKIELLREEYSRGVEGIKAWRSSPVNKLYLEIGAESINDGQPIDIIISKRRKEGKEYLDEKEFEAIINLNKVLRF